MPSMVMKEVLFYIIPKKIPGQFIILTMPGNEFLQILPTKYMTLCWD